MLREEDEGSARAGVRVRSAGSRKQKTDGIARVPSGRDLISPLVHTQFGGANPESGHFQRVDLRSGLVYGEF